MNKKILIYIILITLLLYGCNSSNPKTSSINLQEGIPEITQSNSSEMVTKLDIYLDSNYYPEDTSLLTQFSDTVKNINGMEIKVMPITKNFTSEVIQGKISGLALISFDELCRLQSIADKMFEPLNEYLVNNERFNELPKMHQELTKSENDIIWGIPYSTEPNLTLRIYNEEAIERNNIIALPETLKEFRETLINVSNKENIIINLNSKHPFRNLEDILTANYVNNFNFYNNYDYGNNIEKLNNIIFWGYDAGLGWIADFADDKVMNDFLIYTADLMDNGLLSIDQNGEAFTEVVKWDLNDIHKYYSFDLKNDYSESEDFVRTLDYKYQYVYVLIKGTKNPDRVINTFIDFFYGTEEGNIIGQYPLGYNKENDLNVLISKEMKVPKLGIVGQWVDSYYPVTFDYYPDIMKEEQYSYQSDYYRYISNGISNREIYMPNYVQSFTYKSGIGFSRFNSPINDLFREFLQKKYNYEEVFDLICDYIKKN